MDVTPIISAAGAPFAYEEYLLTPEWRKKRDRALARASWHCQRCNSRRDLQVHHRTYERIGAELDTDLEVLCGKCHKRHHIREREKSESGIYLKIVREAIKAEPYGTIADISETAKRLCAAHHVPYQGPEIHHAVGLLTHARVVSVTVATLTTPPHKSPAAAAVTAQLAHEILGKLGVHTGDVIKTMPDGFLPHQGSVLEQARTIRQEMRTQREIFTDRLNGIFAARTQTETDDRSRIWRDRDEIARYLRAYGGHSEQA